MAKSNKTTKSHKKTKKTRTKKSKKKVEVQEAATSEPVVVVVSEPIVEVAPTPEVEVSLVQNTINDITKRVNSLYDEIKSLKGDLKLLGSQWKKERKELKKNRKKRRNNNGKKRAPSGFAKPALISNDLCDFIGKAHGSLMARTSVTKFLTNYIKVNDLQNPKNRKQIKPDKKLQHILGPLIEVDKHKGYTYFNLQRYLKNHFEKSNSTTTTVSASS